MDRWRRAITGFSVTYTIYVVDDNFVCLLDDDLSIRWRVYGRGWCDVGKKKGNLGTGL